MPTVLNNKAVLTMSTSSSCLYINYCSWVNWPQHPFTLKIPCYRLCTEEKWTVKKCDFVNVSVVINSFFLDYWYHASHLIHLIFASCYVRDTYCSRHFNFAIFFVSRKCHVIRYTEVSLHWIVPKLATPDRSRLALPAIRRFFNLIQFYFFWKRRKKNAWYIR